MDRIYENMLNIFDEYDISHYHEGCDKIYDTWLKAKKPLMDLLSKHPNWNPEKKYIAFDTDWNREPDMNKIVGFFDYVSCNLTFGNRDKISILRHVDEQRLSQSVADVLNRNFPDLKARKGQKTSKIVRRILLSLGFSEKDEEFRQRYANYSDAINPLKIKRHTVVSVNLIDYLLSSNGNSWSSCHTLDKDNPNGYSGAHCSGTLSYALDDTTIVFYQVDKSYEGEDLELQPKIIRQMFHYNDGNLVQGRLYPQCNDGKNSLYVPTREIMQRIMAECTEEPNLWMRRKGTHACGEFCETCGTNYPDYIHNEECSISRLYNTKFKKIFIGHDPICPVCGAEHRAESFLTCKNCSAEYHCTQCGEPIYDERNVYWVDGEPYCGDCVTYCECCNEYEVNEKTAYYGSVDKTLCDYCVKTYYKECCHCGTLVHKDDVYEDVYGNTYCYDCSEEELVFFNGNYYPEKEARECKNCGELFVGEGDYCCETCAEEDADEE